MEVIFLSWPMMKMFIAVVRLNMQSPEASIWCSVGNMTKSVHIGNGKSMKNQGCRH